MPELPFFVVHGTTVYWALLCVVALLGPVAIWLAARRRARIAAGSALADLGEPIALEAASRDELVVLEGVLEIAPEGGPGSTTLVIGSERVPIEGDAEIVAGTHERWTVRRTAPRRFVARRNARVAPGSRVRAAGKLVGSSSPPSVGREYRRGAASFALAGHADGERVRIAATGPRRVSLDSRAAAIGLVVSGVLGWSALWAAGNLAGKRAWSAALAYDDATTATVVRWAPLCAAVPSLREWCLNALEAGLSVMHVRDPETARDRVFLAASLERYRTGACGEVIDWIARGSRYRLVAELGEACADPASLRHAGFARLQLAEYPQASDLAARAATVRSAKAEDDQRALDLRSSLLAGRLDRAAEALKRAAEASDDEGRPWLGCSADAIAARAGDAAARGRLEAATWNTTADKKARGLCALLLADLADGSERLRIVNQARGDAGVEKYRELEWLELEADPRRAKTQRVSWFASHPAWILSGNTINSGLAPLAWHAVAKLAAVAEPTPEMRRARVNLALDVARQSALYDADDQALRLSGMIDGDLSALRALGDPIDGDLIADVAIQRAFIDLRAGRAAAAPALQGVQRTGRLGFARELAAVIAFVERGAVDALREPVEFATFAAPARNDLGGAHAGLAIAAGGSGDALVAWLDGKVDSVALGVALLGARRVTTNREALLRWLHETPRFGSRFESLDGHLGATAMRADIAAALQAEDVASRYRSIVERGRAAVLRRETAIVIQLVGL